MTGARRDPRRLEAKVGMTGVLHTWASAPTHHPHIHMIVPGGGLSPDGTNWVTCKPGFFLHVRVLSRLFRRLFTDSLLALHHAGDLSFHSNLAGLADERAFRLPRPILQDRMGGLRQTALRRPRGRASLSEPLYP